MLCAFLLFSLEKRALDPVSVTRSRLSACSAPYENYCVQDPQRFLGNAIFSACMRLGDKSGTMGGVAGSCPDPREVKARLASPSPPPRRQLRLGRLQSTIGPVSPDLSTDRTQSCGFGSRGLRLSWKNNPTEKETNPQTSIPSNDPRL